MASLLHVSFLSSVPPSPEHRRILLLPARRPGMKFPLTVSATLPLASGYPDSLAQGKRPSSSVSDGGVEGVKDRRRAVKIAWEKLVRWSRSWRSKARADVLEKTNKVVVLGGGSFGTAMAAHVAGKKAEMEVAMLVRDEQVCRSINERHRNPKYFPDFELPENLVATSSPKDALGGADFCLHAVPVQYSSNFLQGISEHVDPRLPFISLSKGLELNTLRTMSQIIPQALRNPRQPFIVLSGPCFAKELMKKMPTAMVAASKDKRLAIAVQQLLASTNLRISSSRCGNSWCTEECPSDSSWYCRRNESWE
ncbi:hypothetical protein HPP92_019052 [Vanilla planifolia]|uniref:Glycerol-3-phosphate dehydrogenase NAD-dependent N-terminal domain-containing protein n=1 Tax=Vanilla planifolia TaxID=51239 RepID=A0A835QGT4_VANPL|nr:hypothetical protein HPP92_019052 [Vanilla planifolia]